MILVYDAMACNDIDGSGCGIDGVGNSGNVSDIIIIIIMVHLIHKLTTCCLCKWFMHGLDGP